MDAKKLLIKMFGESAEFRDDQLESILSILEEKRVLIVQRTGWGKSVVYFITAKILRERGQGITIVISPLLSLIRNQIISAANLNITVRTINSSNYDSHEEIINELKNDEIDVLMIAPEQIANESRFEKIRDSISTIGMLVIDEAHCISDWGHDFRPDYQRISDIISTLPKNIPVVSTTATANDRVIEDIMNQIGNIKVIRGKLRRDSLIIQPIELNNRNERLAWILENINKINGSGIIYCLTIRDTTTVSNFLTKNGVSAFAYHSQLDQDEKLDLEERFYKNEIKCLVATIALGMGYDKPDISFVIHFQRPKDLVSYYQQIGRAGRNIDIAHAIMFNGEEDDDIHNHFIQSAFPTNDEMSEVIRFIEMEEIGIKKADLLEKVNLPVQKIDNTLKYLSVKNIIRKDKNKLYYRTLQPFNIDIEKNRLITEKRYQEYDKVSEMFQIDTCYMQFVSKELDDYNSEPCNKCYNCTGIKKFKVEVDPTILRKAQAFLSQLTVEIAPRKRFPFVLDGKQSISPEYQSQFGFALCYYKDPVLGYLVYDGKYNKNSFCNELVVELSKLINNKLIIDGSFKITYIPSIRHPSLVKTLAKSVSEYLGIELIDALEKITDTMPQKHFMNGTLQAKNAYNSFNVKVNINNENLILIDDIVDSRWTITMCSYKLLKKGANKIYPFSLAVNR